MTKNVILFGLGSIGVKHLALIQKEFKNTKLIILKSSKTNISNYKNIIFVDNFNNLKNITIFVQSFVLLQTLILNMQKNYLK